MAERVEARVRGRVQAVGFRDFVRHEATARGLVGFVRNWPDGSVEVVAEGPRAELEALLERLREGPPAARVDRVDASWTAEVGGFAGFSISWGG